MKQLLILLIVSVSATFANAASATWSAYLLPTVPNENVESIGGWTAYLYCTTLSQEYIVKTTVEYNTNQYMQNYVSATNISLGTVADSTALSFYFEIVGTDNEGQSWTYTSTELIANTGSNKGGVDVNWEDTLKDTNNLWAKTGENAPEPTSGLLLLLGVAGLALKRKRA